MPLCDLVVGTEEEIRIAGGSVETLSALRRIRECSNAVIVVKRGSAGASIFDGRDAIDCPGFQVEVFNVLGAGDGFMAGLLAGWLRGKSWEESGRLANACGALVVARHGCAPAMPTRTEVDAFLMRAHEIRSPRTDPALVHVHRATTRPREHAEVLALAIDQRRQFEELAQRHDAPGERIARFKELVAEAIVSLRSEVESLGAIIDERYGRAALDRLTGTGLWLARPVELPGSRPLAFENTSAPAIFMRSWPAEHVAKCLAVYSAEDPATLRERQERMLLLLQEAAIATGREWLLELIPPPSADMGGIAASMERLYAAGLKPDWWKLPPSSDRQSWRRIGEIIDANDPHSRGVLVLGLDSSEDQLGQAFAAAANEPLVRGFAVGRTIFWPTAEAWFGGTISDANAVRAIAETFLRVAALWHAHRNVTPGQAQRATR
jgi:5-dehydro-2-deoxygluconokinase